MDIILAGDIQNQEMAKYTESYTPQRAQEFNVVMALCQRCDQPIARGITRHERHFRAQRPSDRLFQLERLLYAIPRENNASYIRQARDDGRQCVRIWASLWRDILGAGGMHQHSTVPVTALL